MTAGTTIRLDESCFDALVLRADRPLLVNFGATWCGPCRALAPAVDALAAELEGRVRVGTLDVDESRAIATRYGIRSVPTVVPFAAGAPVDQVVGAVPKHRLAALVERHAGAGTRA